MAIVGLVCVSAPATAAPPDDSGPPDTLPDESSDSIPDDDIDDVGPATPPIFGAPPLVPGQQVVSAPLIPVPAGCAAPDPARVVFVGTLLMADTTTGRFVIERVLAGSPEGYAAGRIIDVRYGIDARFLDPDTRYIVGAGVQRSTGVLMSKVREDAPLFGGDAVIGLDDTDVECPRLEDPVRTLLADGTSVDSGVFTPLQKAKRAMLWAILRPVGVGFLVLLGLVLLKHLLFAMGRSVRDLFVRPEEPLHVRRRRRHHDVGPLDASS